MSPPNNNTINIVDTTASLSLILTIVWVIDQYYASATTSPVLIGQYARTKKVELEQKNLIEEILKQTSKTATVKYLLKSYNRYSDQGDDNDIGDLPRTNEEDIRHFYRKKDNAIWFIDSLRSFRYLEADLLTERENYNRNGFYCIVYTGQGRERMKIVKTIFHRLFAIYVININVLLIENETTQAYTYFPFTSKQCHHSGPHLIGSLGPSTDFQFTAPIFFHKKLSNMWGCNLTITTWSEPPFIIIENKKLRGIEGLLVMELADRMNFTLNIKPPPQNERGFIFPNGTATGATKMLIDCETNITIICLMYDNTRLKYSEAAYTYISAPLVVGMSKGRRMTPFERLLRPFKYIIWSCFSSSLLFGILFIYALKYYCKSNEQSFVFGDNNRIPFTNFWNVLYGGPIHRVMPRRNFARYLLALWIIYTWILRTAYTGQLFILLQDARARSNLKTLNELIRNNYTFFTFPVLVPILFDESKRPAKLSFVNGAEHSLPKIFHRLGRENVKIVVTVLGQLIRNYNQKAENREYQISVLPEPILMAPLTFYMPKHSYLSYEINHLLLRIMSAGLISHFEDLSLDDRSVWKRRPQEPVMLSLWLLLGIFAVYLVLMVLCSFVFLLELWSTRSPITKKIIDFLDF